MHGDNGRVMGDQLIDGSVLRSYDFESLSKQWIERLESSIGLNEMPADSSVRRDISQPLQGALLLISLLNQVDVVKAL